MPTLENARWERFAQNIVSGMTQRKAYRDAFPDSNKLKDKSIDNKAWKLSKEEEIQTRIKELQEESANVAIMSATERKIWLSNVVRDDNEPTNFRIKAIDTLNRMTGEYIEKVEHSGTVSTETVITIDGEDYGS